MGARRTARERALQALFQLDEVTAAPVVSSPSVDAKAALEQAWSASDDEGPRAPAAQTFALEIVEGVRAQLAELDPLIEKQSHNWRLERMSRVDRNVLRLGAWELKFRADIPRKVTLNEAVELAKTFSTDDSGKFVNGLLSAVAADLRPG